MKTLLALFSLSFLFLNPNIISQTWSIHLNANETYPLFNDQKGYYPILWYSSNDDQRILVGGFGAGISYQRPLKERVSLKFQSNVQRARFYDEPILFYDENGNPLKKTVGVNTNLNASLLGMVVFPISQNQKWFFSGGLGARGTFSSKTDFGEADVNGQKTSLKLKNKSLSPFVVILPVEITKYFGTRFSASARAELGLTKTSRLSAYSKERSAVVFVELGYRLGN